jgi:putative transposase
MSRPQRTSPRAQHDPEFRVKVVKTSLEKNLSVDEAHELYGIGAATWYTWKKIFAVKGEDALRKYGMRSGREQKPIHPELKRQLRDRTVETKRKYPFYGVHRVWQWVVRTFFLPVSFRQVRQTMAEEKLIGKVPKKKRSPRKPRGFERAKPNELWATDITEFDLAGGQTVYLLAFIDDYSRFITSWGVYTSCVTELVLEVLRRGISVYGRPGEILTDHGPQYWVRRGKTQFQKFLQREDITHIKASTPEANGKIEAFWGTIKKEFVEETKRKGDLEEIRDRIAHWIAFYNFQRLHTEVGGAPAERYFQYQEALRAEIQKRVRKNAKELALSKTPPSQILGKSSMGEQIVEIRKEGDGFVVTLGDQVLTDKKEEKNDATQEGTARESGRGGSGGEVEGVAGAGRPGGGEIDLGSLPPDGNQADAVLQARGADGAGDVRGGDGEAGTGPQEGPAGGSVGVGNPDGGSPAGASTPQEPGAGDQEAVQDGAAESPENGPQEAERGLSGAERSDGAAQTGTAGSDGGDGSVTKEG